LTGDIPTARKGGNSMLVKEILDTKGHEFWSVSPDTSVHDAIRLMVDKAVGSVLVV